MKPRLVVVAVVVAAAALSLSRVRLSPDIGDLLPDRGDAAALSEWLRAFGGGDPGLVLVEADDPRVAEEAASALVIEAPSTPGIIAAWDRPAVPEVTPTQAMLLADARTWPAIEEAMSPAGMRRRLSETRALLLAPGAAAMMPTIVRDPLRLGELVAGSLGDSRTVSDDGRARLVVLEPRGSSLKSNDARAFVRSAESAIDVVKSRVPGARFSLAGGHAIATDTERTLRRDLALSSIAAVVLVSAAFIAVLRRVRALVAILPPLALGTLMAASLAAAFPHGLSGIAVAFASVVVGVGTDTGVHLYAATQAAIARGDPNPATAARRDTMRAVLGAATVAAGTFGCLAFSSIEALRQLGILAGAGELLTALTLLALTPEMAVWLERRGAKPSTSTWPRAIVGLATSRAAGVASLIVGLSAVVAVALGAGARVSTSMVAFGGNGAPAKAYARIAERLDRDPHPPIVAMVVDTDDEAARARVDRMHDALATRRDLVRELYDATTVSPSRATLERRLAARAKLSLDGEELARALTETGFSAARFAGAVDDLRHPSPPAQLGALRARVDASFVTRNEGRTLATLQVVAMPGREADVESLLRSVDPAVRLTGIGHLDRVLRATLEAELPRVGLLAFSVALVSLAWVLRRAAGVALALGTIVIELALTLLLMRALGVELHVYDALVLPVLVGVTLDEVLFVHTALRAASSEDEARAAILHEAPLVATTALTTAAGFGALIVCESPKLRDLGATGAIGSIVGLVLALGMVPAVTRWGRPESR